MTFRRLSQPTGAERQIGAKRRIGAKTLFAFALGSLSPQLFAQDQLARDIAFVRSLARDMRFIELARIEAEELAKANKSSGSDQEKIAQLAVEVAYYGARSRNDRALQRTLFKETITKSKELIETSSDAGVQSEARGTLANASQDFGQFLVEELEIARSESPDRVKELEEEAIQVFRTGIEACTKVMESLKEAMAKDDEKRTEYFLMWMKKGVLTREQGRADKANRTVLCDRAIEDLSELVLEVGEETVIGLRGLFEIAQCKEVDGKIPEAIDTYQGTIKQIATSLEQAGKGELELSGELQGFLFEMLQEVYVRTGEVMVREGAPATAELFAEFRKHMAAFGEKDVDLFDVVSDQHGHLMLLTEARFQAESGDPKKVGDALAMAQKINDQHPSDYVGVRAKAVLRDILALQRNLVSGSLLFEVAKGELQNKNYEEGIKGMRRALAAMTPDEQTKLGLEGYEMMGLGFAFSERYLEAMLALREGLQRFGATDEKRATEVGDACDRALGQHKRLTKNDPAFAQLYRETSELLAVHSPSAGDKLFWKDGITLLGERKFKEAAAAFGKIAPTYDFYEQALVNMARAQAAGGELAAARTTLASYRDYVAKTALSASDTAKQAARATAIADAEYTEAGLAYTEARGSEEFKVAKDLTKYPQALEKAQAFLSNFAKDGERHVPVVLEYVVRLNTDLGKLDQAEAAYAQLKEKDALRASRVATEIFQEYQTQVAALSTELDRTIAKGEPDAKITKAGTDLTNARRKLVALGMDYIASSPKPQVAILVGTMLNWEELGEWKRVEEVAQKTLDLYGKETAEGTKRVVDQLVRPKIGESLLRQRRFQEAYDMLIAAEKANPAQWELKRQIARALGGWFEFDKQTGQGLKVVGLEKPAEAFHRYFADKDNAYRVWGLRPEVQAYSLEWYRFYWEAYWFAKQASAKDGKMKEHADTLYRKARATDDFATLKGLGAQGFELYRYFQSNR